jgi:hypothetical protein
MMRTTLAIDDDVLEAAKAIAGQSHRSLGDVISELARKSLARPERGRIRNGVPLLPVRKGAMVTQDIVNALRDELP